MADDGHIDGTTFVWRHGRDEVALRREGASWTVVHTAAGRLLGPRQVRHRGLHRQATFAAWDVMARVIKVSRDEDRAVRVARHAARWMNAADADSHDGDEPRRVDERAW